jgi:hypothetical protein
MTATQIAPSFDRIRVWTAVVALSATFGIGLLTGLNVSRSADHGTSAVSLAGAAAQAPLWSKAQSLAAFQAYRQGERADPGAAQAPLWSKAQSLAAFQAYRQGERADLGH